MYSLAEKIVILACLLGISIMLWYHHSGNDNIIYLTLIPVALLIIAKRLNKRDLDNME